MTKEKYALLDTDFISKTHLIRKDDQNKMIDRIMEMQGYQFFCHEQIKIELKRHNIGNSPAWLETKIIDGSVHCMSDEEILDDLYSIYSNSAVAMYVSMLRNGCEAYKKGYFEENFTRLQALDYLSISKESFLQKLKEDAEPYIQAYLNECRKHNQTTFKVHDTSKQMRMRKVPCEQVVEEMYSGKLELLQNGNLRYKQ